MQVPYLSSLLGATDDTVDRSAALVGYAQRMRDLGRLEVVADACVLGSACGGRYELKQSAGGWSIGTRSRH